MLRTARYTGIITGHFLLIGLFWWRDCFDKETRKKKKTSWEEPGKGRSLGTDPQTLSSSLADLVG